MKLLKALIFLGTITIAFTQAPKTAKEHKLVCYYDSASYVRPGFAKLLDADLMMAMEFCTHLVYGYAGIHPTSFEAISLNVDLDMFHYAEITALKSRFPQLKVLLSVGGDKDIDEAHPNKYVQLLEANRTVQQSFIDSAVQLLRSNGFDGIDLAFQLPRNKPRKVHSTLAMYWKQFKKIFTGNFIVDEQAEQHKQQYTELSKLLKYTFRAYNLSTTMTVLPNVNSTWYFDVPNLVNYYDFVNLAAFDFLTPERNPEEADYTAALYLRDEQERLPHYCVDFQVRYWLDNLWPADKLHLGIAAYGRAWKMTSGSGLTGAPVVPNTDGPADTNSQFGPAGVLSWPDICAKMPRSVNANFRGENAPLRRVTDLEQKYGNYALRPADEHGEHGLWVSYDDPDFAGIKAAYARQHNLGGVALFDLSFDDFRGLCTGQKYPILRSIKYNL